MPNTRLALAFTLAGCATALAQPPNVGMEALRTDSAEIASARARGPVALAELLATYDDAKSGEDRTALAQRIDAVAGQRYATVSRLYWYTDLAQAEAAASKQHKPILALRMLGRLDEDLSCANSRLFRATLYANTEISAFMRDNFVLYWSSEREVPKVTIDFGGGRKVTTTITGNSAHYVLAPDGTVLDVLPGMYAPSAFRSELVKSLALAKRVAALAPPARATAVRTYHAQASQAGRRRAAKLTQVAYLPGDQLTSKSAVAAAAMRAQRSTMAKAYIEVPQLRAITADAIPTLPESETAAWAALGQELWPAYAGEPSTPPPTGPFTPGAPPRVLDDASRLLVGLLHNHASLRATAAETATVIARLEQHLVADSALNELRLRSAIHARMMQTSEPFSALNEFVYANVFHTPATDAWLGLVPRTDFTGLPGDGVAGSPPAVAHQ